MARRRHYGKRRGKHSFKIPVLSLAILGGQAAAAGFGSGELKYAIDNFQSFYTGIQFLGDKQFHGEKLVVGYAPWLVKGLVMRIARPLGAAPRIPFGLPISIN